ncbi:hypothetical protein FRB99_003949 [Tulasnella sp. 403]|nr:hypothetical protein FRB99_003949 [Tulasnella sp. 403]
MPVQNPPPPVGYVAPAHMAEEPVSCFQDKIDTEPLDDASIAPNVTVGGSLAGLSLDSSPASLLAKSAFLPSATPTTSIAPEPQTNHEESPHHSVLVGDANLNATSDGLVGDFRLQLSDG